MVGDSPGDAGRTDPRSDDQLMAELASGHQEALQVLHGRHAPLVFHLACRSLGAPAAEEVTQDVFLRVWQKARDFDPDRGSFRSWILQIARRRVLNELRERGRRPQFDRDSEARLLDLAARDAGPEEQLWAHYRKTAIQRALSALPDEQKQALSLAFFQDLSHEQVAHLLAVPLGTAKGRIRLGLEKLNSPLAALVALVIAAMGLSAYGWIRHRSAWRLDERALAMLTGSRMQALRLEPPSAHGRIEQGAHATYRAEPEGSLVVFTLANLPVPPGGTTYRLWRLGGAGWQALGDPRPDAQGRARLIFEASAQPWPEALRLTLESQGPAGPAPAGSLVLAWPSAGSGPSGGGPASRP